MNRLIWTPELVEKFWDGVWRTRLRELSFSRLAGSQLLQIVRPWLSDGAKCLDFGAGEGDLVEKLLASGFPAAAYEPNSERRANLLSRAFCSHSKFLGVVGDGHPESFDVVFATEVLEHVLDSELDAVLARISRFLRPGGLLIVTTPNREDLELSSVYCPLSDALFHRWQHVRSFDAASLNELLSRFQFERVHQQWIDFSGAAELHDRKQELERRVFYLSFLGPLYYLVAPLRRWRSGILARRSVVPPEPIGGNLLHVSRRR